jgi:hypothetical protein
VAVLQGRNGLYQKNPAEVNKIIKKVIQAEAYDKDSLIPQKNKKFINL